VLSVIPAKVGIQEIRGDRKTSGSRIKSGMTIRRTSSTVCQEPGTIIRET
jgi:hypothetical protein